MSEKALKIAEKRREMKRKGERERYITLNAELQRIEEKDKNGNHAWYGRYKINR